VRYFEGIYAYSQDTLFINQFIASTLNWASKAKTVSIVTDYPASDTITINVTGAGPMPVKIRSPWWVRRPIQIWINDAQRHIGKIPPATYFKLDGPRGWKGGGTIKLVIPKTLRVEVCTDHPATGQVFYGGLALYGVTSSASFQALDCGAFTKGAGLTWTASGTTFKPFYNVASDHYSMYWNISNVPANWQDTILDAIDDPPTAIDNDAFGEDAARAMRPSFSLTKSGTRISFSLALKGETPLHIRLFDTRGAVVWDCKGAAHRGDRSVELRKPIAALSAGTYIGVISAGAVRFTTRLMVERE
jgi:hypothetical protein